MSRSDQSLIAFMVAAFCLVCAATIAARLGWSGILGTGLMGFLGATCIIAGISLRRNPPA